MKITLEEEQLIIEATQGLNSVNIKYVRNFLKSLAESRSWFHGALFSLIKNNVSFIDRQIETAAQYSLEERKIIFNSDFLNATTLPQEILKEAFIIALRHEVTHAIDHQHMLAIGTKKIVTNQMIKFQALANSLYNQLVCIDRKKVVHTDVLDKFKFLVHQYSNTSKQILFSSGTPNTDYAKLLDIRNLGTYLAKSGYNKDKELYITNIWHIGETGHSVIAATFDTELVKEILKKIEVTRQPKKFTIFKQSFSDNYKLQQLGLWQKLTLEQRQTLNSLYMIGERIFSNIKQDPKCFPKLKTCLSKFQENCLEIFMTCQNNLTNKDISYETNLELRACLHERSEGELMLVDIINQLCTTPSRQSAEVYSDELILEEPVRYTWLSGISYGLIDELSKFYMENAEFKNIPLWKILVNISYLLISYSLSYYFSEEGNSLFLQLAISISLTIFSNGIEYAKLFSPVKNTLLKASIGGAALTADLIIEGPQALATAGKSAGGIILGSILGYSMGSALGWKTTTEKAKLALINTIKTIPANDLETFAPFIKVVKNQEYSKAFRTACTSSHPKALELIKIFLKYKEQFSIDINERAGDDKLSALHQAAKKHNTIVYNYLITQGANRKLRDKSGVSARKYYQQSAPQQPKLESDESKSEASHYKKA